MRMKKFALAFALIAALALPMFAAVNYNLNLGTEPPNLDAQIATDTTSGMILAHVQEGLVRYAKDGSIMAGMAEKWTVSPDGKTYTFTMRKNVKWSNGDPVTAADFEFGIKRALDPATASEYAYILFDIANAEKANAGEVGLDQVGVKANGNTLTITLKGPVPYFLSILCFPTAQPLNEKFFKTVGDKYASDADKMLYNGPYFIKEWKHSDKMILAKSTSYWNAKEIKLDTITGYMITDSNTAVTMFYNKELDQIGIPGPRVQEFKDKGYAVQVFTDAAVFYIEMGENNPALKNLNIRKAVNAALDRDSFCKNVLKTSSLPAMAFVSPTIMGLKKTFRDEVPATFYKDNDSAAAKAFLAAGLKELNLTALPPLNMICDDSDRAKLYAAAVQDMLKKNAGIEVAINPMPFKARLQKMSSRDYDLVMAGWGPDYNDPMTYLDMWVTDGGNNHTGWSNAKYDDLIAKAKAEPAAAKRMGYLVDAEKLLMAELPIAPIYWRFNPWAAQTNVSGIVRRGVGPDPDLYWTVKK